MHRETPETRNDTADTTEENQKLDRTENLATAAKITFGAGSLIVSTQSLLGGLALFGIGESLGYVLGHINKKRYQNVVKLHERTLINGNLTTEEFEFIASEPDKTPLVEKAFLSAAESDNDERIEVISNILVNGCTDNAKTVVAKQFLSMINELSDMELGLLLVIQSAVSETFLSTFSSVKKHAFVEKWFNMKFNPMTANIPEMMQYAPMIENAIRKLIYLGLVFKSNSPETDESTSQPHNFLHLHDFQNNCYELTNFGNMFCDYTHKIPHYNDGLIEAVINDIQNGITTEGRLSSAIGEAYRRGETQ
jgi:hypothetical protein